MRSPRCILILLLISAAAVATAGDIQISCEPGLSIFLDGAPVGVSSAKEDGLYLLNVKKGKHTIRVEKEGFIPQDIEVEVGNLPIEVTVEEFVPQPVAVPSEPAKPAQTTESQQLVGSLVVTSAPQNCVVEIDGRSEEKSTPYLSMGGLPAGEHTISFSKPGYESISGKVTIRPGVESTVRGNLKAGKVEVIHTGKGALRILSEPQKCTIRFMGKIHEKFRLKLNLGKIPAGVYPLEAEIAGRKLATQVAIMDGYRTVVQVSFMKGDKDFVITHQPL